MALSGREIRRIYAIRTAERKRLSRLQGVEPGLIAAKLQGVEAKRARPLVRIRDRRNRSKLISVPMPEESRPVLIRDRRNRSKLVWVTMGGSVGSVPVVIDEPVITPEIMPVVPDEPVIIPDPVPVEIRMPTITAAEMPSNPAPEYIKKTGKHPTRKLPYLTRGWLKRTLRSGAKVIIPTTRMGIDICEPGKQFKCMFVMSTLLQLDLIGPYARPAFIGDLGMRPVVRFNGNGTLISWGDWSYHFKTPGEALGAIQTLDEDAIVNGEAAAKAAMQPGDYVFELTKVVRRKKRSPESRVRNNQARPNQKMAESRHKKTPRKRYAGSTLPAKKEA